MKRIFAFVMTVCLMFSVASSLLAADLVDYTTLPNYEPFPQLTAEENHEYYLAHKGMTSEEVLEFEIERTEEDDYIPLMFTFKNIRDNAGMEFVMKYEADVKVSYVSDSMVLMYVKKTAVREVMSDEVLANVYFPFPEDRITNGTPGDTTGDGEVNFKDVSHLLRYLAGWEGYFIDSDCADYNGDYLVNFKDVAALIRYLSEEA